MNRVYKSIWNAKSGTYIAAAETARAAGKSGSSRSLASATLLLALAPSLAWAAPTAGVVTAGAGSIVRQGDTTTINQSSATLSLNWASFNVGAHETVQFVQPGAASIAVNRILDTAGSQILGRLNANGQVYLINPNGILFGQGAQVNVGGLVASTLDAVQLNGNSVSLSGTGQGSVVNQGQIEGRYVALIGNTVANEGAINTPKGTTALGAGSAVTLSFAGSDLMGLQVDAGVLNALARNGGLIQADGGRVLLSAGAKDDLLASVVNNTGIVRARTVDQRGGEIVLLGGMASGTVQLSGTLDASAPGGGQGGAIDTSAAHVQVAGDAQVTTLSSTGQNGSWLIDPTDFTIGSGGSISGSTLSASLGSGNVSILSSAGASTGAGNIYVNEAVSWGANLLTLTAAKDIVVNAVMNGTGSASLALNPATANGSDAAVTGGAVKMGLGAAGSVNAGTGNAFTGQVNFNSAGTLSISGNSYTVINSLGSAGSTTGTDLQGINGNLAGRYVLGSNIDATSTSGWNAGAGFSPIGLGTGSGTFTGVFNGLGHSIDGLTANLPSTGGVGLFTQVNNASISNVGLIAATVAGSAYVGQLIGYATNATIGNAYASGTVTSGGGNGSVGGLIGQMAGGTVSDSFAAGSLTSTGGGNVGGFIGLVEGPSLVDKSYSTMTVNSTNVVGGLVGAASGGSGTITISNSYATGNITGSLDTVGGLIGYNGAIVSNSYAAGTVSAPGGRIGGLVGHNGASVTASYATGAVSSANGSELGGLIGRNDIAATVDSSYATGNVSSQGNQQGGLVGRNLRTIRNSYATGTVGDGGVGLSSSVGGLVGQTDGGSSPSITNSYATGAVSGGSYVGGILGRMGAGGTVSNSFYLSGVNGAVTGLGSSGSFRTSGGSNAGIADVAGTSYSMSLAQLQTRLNLTSATSANGNVNPGWDFNTTPIWGYEAGRNNDMPVPCAFVTCVLTITVYVAPVTGSNVYGSAPLFSYSLVDAGGSPYSLSNASVVGTALFTGSPSLPSSSSGAGSYSLSYASGLSLSGSGASLYVLSPYSLPTAWTVTKAPLTVTALNASQTYTASAFSGGNGVSYSGFVNSETSAVLGGSLSYAGSAQGARNVGSYALTPQGLSSSNYTISYANGTLAITPAALTLAAASASKTYDGTLASSGVVAVTGLLGSDSVSGSSQSYNSKDVASATTVNVNSGYTVNDGNGGANYTVATSSAAGSITPAALTVAAQNASQIYNASNYSGGNGVGYSGFVNGETSSVLGGSLSYAGSAQGARNVGSYALTPQGLSSSNYTIGYTGGTLAITPAALTLAAASASKTYDGTLASSGAVTATGLLGSDSVSGASQSYNSKDVVAATTLSVSAYTVNDGNGGGNYTVATTAAAGSITPAALSVTAQNASQTYNASSYSGGNGVSYSGLVNGETSALLGGSLSYTGSAQGARNVGSYTLTPQGLSSSNYAISYANGTLAIMPAALTLAAASASKTYDGTLASSAAVAVTGLLGSDSVSGAGQSYNSKDVASASTLNVNSGYTVNDGNGGGNYTVATSSAAGSITPAALTVAAQNASQIYNASNYSGGNGVGYSGFVNGETSAVLGGALAFAGSAQGARNVGSYTLTPQGLSSSNYAIGYSNGTLVIMPAALTLAASNASKTYDGTLASSGAVAVSGLQGSDSVSGTSQSYNSKDVVGASTLNVNSGYTVNDGNGGANYTVVTRTAAASVTPAVLSYVAAPASMIAGSSSPSLSGTVSGFVGGDTLANATTGALVWSSAVNPTGAPAAYAVQGGGLSAANYVFTQAAGNATALLVQPGVLPPPVVNAVAANMAAQDSILMTSSSNPGGDLLPPASGAGSGGARTGSEVSTSLTLNGLSTLQVTDGGVNLVQFKRPATSDSSK